MFTHQQRGAMRHCVTVVMLLALSAPAWAVPVVLYSVDNLGGGWFQYNLTIDNAGGSEALSGLNVLKGNSVFGLDDTSIIGAPQDIGGDAAADWSFFEPLPPFVDELDYFSLDPAADVPIDATLPGFFFQSMTHPDTLTGDDFAVEGIGADSASQIPLGSAQFIPIPPAFWLFGTGLAGVLAFRHRRTGPSGAG